MMAANRKARRLKLAPDTPHLSDLALGGWLDGKRTYLWIGMGSQCLGTVSGVRLRRFAERVLREMPPDEPARRNRRA